jgi:hypothetical protein
MGGIVEHRNYPYYQWSLTMGRKQFSVADLVRYMLIALAGYLANVIGVVDLPSPYA